MSHPTRLCYPPRSGCQPRRLRVVDTGQVGDDESSHRARSSPRVCLVSDPLWRHRRRRGDRPAHQCGSHNRRDTGTKGDPARSEFHVPIPSVITAKALPWSRPSVAQLTVRVRANNDSMRDKRPTGYREPTTCGGESTIVPKSLSDRPVAPGRHRRSCRYMLRRPGRTRVQCHPQGSSQHVTYLRTPSTCVNDPVTR